MGEWLVGEDSVSELVEGGAETGRLYEALFGSLGVDVSKGATTEDVEIPREERRVRGYRGTEQAGYRWSEIVPLESSMFPTEVEEETYGLPGMQVSWRYRWAQQGQLGRSRFEHVRLAVRFDDESARAAFVDAGTKLTGRGPKLERA